MNRARLFLIVAVAILDRPEVARAGMPMVVLTDIARMRLQTLSFFLLCLLFCAWVIQRIWNATVAEFPRLPRLGFRKAMGVMVLWGLLFVLILTMISGARELMTPGAWKKVGYTYEFDEPTPRAPVDEREEERRHTLDRLRIALWTYARGHDGRFPSIEDEKAIPDDAWQVPDASRMRYLYVPGQSADVGESPLAYEPGLFGSRRLVLRTDGRIVLMTPDEILRATSGGRTP